MNKMLLISLFGVVVLLLVLVGVSRLTKSKLAQKTQPSPATQKRVQPRPKSNYSQQISGGQCQGSGPVTFTHSPLKVENIGIILPLGLVTDAHVTPIDHMYFSPKEFRSEIDKYPVYAIADGTIVKIQHRGIVVGDKGRGGKSSDYRLDIEYTCTFYSYYDLLTSLAPDISAKVKLDTSKPGDTAAVRIPIKAGQEIGRVGGRTVDWAVYNTEVELPGLLVPDHYRREAWKIHTDPDQFKYFAEPLRSQLTALLARKAEPRTGKIDYDIDGKAVGNWFKEGTNGYEGVIPDRYWDGHLSLTYDYIDPTQIRFSIGDFNNKSAQFGVKNNTPDPASIDKSTGIVKYELVYYDYYNKDTNGRWRTDQGPIPNPGARNLDQVLGVALVQLVDTRKLKVEVFPGKTGAQVTGFTQAAVLYER